MGDVMIPAIVTNQNATCLEFCRRPDRIAGSSEVRREESRVRILRRRIEARLQRSGFQAGLFLDANGSSFTQNPLEYHEIRLDGD